MATNLSPLANTPIRSLFYSDASVQSHQLETSVVGTPGLTSLSSNTGLTTGNGSYVIFAAAMPVAVYQTTFTVLTAGTGATSNIQVYKIAANNGANLSSNIALGNLVTTGVNVAGNVSTTGPYAYNLTNAGVNTGSFTVTVGGINLNTGDLLIAVSTGNTLVAAAATEYSVAGPILN